MTVRQILNGDIRYVVTNQFIGGMSPVPLVFPVPSVSAPIFVDYQLHLSAPVVELGPQLP